MVAGACAQARNARQRRSGTSSLVVMAEGSLRQSERRATTDTNSFATGPAGAYLPPVAFRCAPAQMASCPTFLRDPGFSRLLPDRLRVSPRRPFSPTSPLCYNALTALVLATVPCRAGPVISL